MLGGGDPVGVDRLDVVGVGLAAPADQEPLGDRASPGRSRAAARAGGRRRGRTAPRTRAPSPTRGRAGRGPASSEMSISGSKPHSGAEHRQRGLDVDARVAGADRERVRLGRRQARARACRRRAGPRPARRARGRRGPRCRRRDSAARRPPCRARRSRWRRRRRLRGRTGLRSWAWEPFAIRRSAGTLRVRSARRLPHPPWPPATSCSRRPAISRPASAAASSPRASSSRRAWSGSGRSTRGPQRVHRGRRRARAGGGGRDPARRHAPVRGRADRDQGQRAGRRACA